MNLSDRVDLHADRRPSGCEQVAVLIQDAELELLQSRSGGHTEVVVESLPDLLIAPQGGVHPPAPVLGEHPLRPQRLVQRFLGQQDIQRGQRLPVLSESQPGRDLAMLHVGAKGGEFRDDRRRPGPISDHLDRTTAPQRQRLLGSPQSPLRLTGPKQLVGFGGELLEAQ